MSLPTRISILSRFLEVPSDEKRLLLEAWWTLLDAAARLRFTPRSTVARALAGLLAPPPESAGTSQVGTSQAVGLAVARAAAHHLTAMTCLPRALALQRMLAKRGIPSALRIGVRKESGGGSGIAAHAWVEVDGVALGEPAAIEERFRPLLPPLTGPSSVRREEHGETQR